MNKARIVRALNKKERIVGREVKEVAIALITGLVMGVVARQVTDDPVITILSLMMGFVGVIAYYLNRYDDK